MSIFGRTKREANLFGEGRAELHMLDVKIICLMLPLRVNAVNCFLLRIRTGWILIDTACSNKRAELERQIALEGCGPGDLKLIILTHGDFDHSGNAKYLRERFSSRVAMHQDDLGMVEKGDMFWNRGKGNLIVKAMAPELFKFGGSERFTPDLYIDDGYDLSDYGSNLRVISLPGHSKGSIGILTGTGELFCGDLLINEKKPVLNYRIADPTAAKASVERLQNLRVETVFPSHGKPFPIKAFLENYQRES